MIHTVQRWVTGLGYVSWQLADADAEKPTSGLVPGSLLYAEDSGALYVATSSTTWASVSGGGGSGEANLGANVGASGVGVYDSKSGVTLNFRKLAAASSKLTITLNSQEIDFDIPDASTSAKGAVQLAASGGTTAGQVVQASDPRLSDSRTPTAHASTHQNGGGDEVATATPSANAIPKAGAGGALAAGWIPSMVAAGGSHAAGGAPDPGATAHTPPYVLGDDAAWHAGSPYQGKYHPDRPVGSSLLYTSASDEFLGGVTVSLTSFNSGQGLTATGEYDTLRIFQTSGTASHIVRGYWLPVPPSGDWRLFIKFENEVSTSGGNAGAGQAGIGLGIGGTSASPDHAEFLRVYGQQSIDWANNAAAAGYGAASSVRASGTTPSNFDQVAQWVYLSFRYTASSRLIEAFYSFSGYQWVSLGSTTPASSAVPVSIFFWVDADSTTLLPSIRLAYVRTRTDLAGYNGASGQ